MTTLALLTKIGLTIDIGFWTVLLGVCLKKFDPEEWVAVFAAWVCVLGATHIVLGIPLGLLLWIWL